ncbi:MAG: hypothetical protein AAGA03_11995 [Planctomycetota bacterium]
MTTAPANTRLALSVLIACTLTGWFHAIVDLPVANGQSLALPASSGFQQRPGSPSDRPGTGAASGGPTASNAKVNSGPATAQPTTPPFRGGSPAVNAAAAAPRSPQVTNSKFGSNGELPNQSGQYEHTYALGAYTGYLTNNDRPHQAVIDWIMRETGTDVWHTEPFGYISADRDNLYVYHTREMHEVVKRVVDRFVAGEKEPQVMSLKVLTCGKPNWRSRAHMLMQHVTVDSPGMQAWLLSKENAAVVLSMLRARTDVREIQNINVALHNGQTEKLASTRGRNYVRNVRQSPAGWPPYEPETGEIQEGYRLEISPLLSIDRRTIDCVLKADIDQVDKLVPVELELPLPNNQVHRTRIDVPQLVSWRLHERFKWPSDMVLLLSCGVVASPERNQMAIPLLNLNSLTGTTAGRADALMFVEFRGRASQNLTTAPVSPKISTRPNLPTRGRY